MKAKHYKYFFKIIKYGLAIFLMFFGISVQAQVDEEEKDSVKTGVDLGHLQLSNPKSITEAYTYDPASDRYIYTKTFDGFNINYPIILTPKEYEELLTRESMREYYQKKLDAIDGKKAGAEQAKKDLLPRYYINSGLFETIFGGNTIDVKPTGSVEMDLGVRFTKQDNPSFSPRNRKSLTFDFDQRISLSLQGKVGTRLMVNANYDTQSTFAFQNLIKLEYTPTEDDIIKKIEVGNVSFPLNSSLIRGAQSLFGAKMQLQFGKTTITGVFSGITGILGNYILIIFYVIFILSEARSIQERITFAFSEEKQEKMSKTIVNIFEDVKGYLFGKTMLSLSQAIVIGIILWAFGVDFYFIWAFLFFITDFIPNVGSLLSSVLVTITMLLQFDNIVTPIIILVILILIQNIKGNIIEPKIFGARLNLSPLLLFLSLVFWGYIWGIVGMMLSVPIMSMIKIVLMNFPQTRPIGILMSYNLTSINKN